MDIKLIYHDIQEHLLETPSTVCCDFARILRESSDYRRNDIDADFDDSAVTIDIFCSDIRDYARSRRALEEVIQELHKRFL